MFFYCYVNWLFIELCAAAAAVIIVPMCSISKIYILIKVVLTKTKTKKVMCVLEINIGKVIMNEHNTAMLQHTYPPPSKKQ